jgi:hypothetical protein
MRRALLSPADDPPRGHVAPRLLSRLWRRLARSVIGPAIDAWPSGQKSVRVGSGQA